MKYITEDSKWVSFYPKFNSSFYIEKAGYFDERPVVHTSLTQLIILVAIVPLTILSPLLILLTPLLFFGWGKLYINLPIKTGIQDSDSAAWGFNYHDNKIWIYVGGGGNFQGGKKWKTITMLWYMTWVRTSTLMQDGSWFNEDKKNRIRWDKSNDIGSYDWLNANKWKETYEYTDKYDNTKVNATISVKEREWRPHGFKWTKLFSKSDRCIEIEFDKEVGKRKGSWKGGTVGCSYTLLKNETPLQCLRRMEKERNF